MKSVLLLVATIIAMCAGETVNCKSFTNCTECVSHSECAFYSGVGKAIPFCDAVNAYKKTITFAGFQKAEYCHCYEYEQFYGLKGCKNDAYRQHCYDSLQMNNGDDEYPQCQPKTFWCNS